jgi:hypothetical protein
LAWIKVFVDGDTSWLPLLETRPDNASRFLLESMPTVDSPPVADAVPDKKAA